MTTTAETTAERNGHTVPIKGSIARALDNRHVPAEKFERRIAELIAAKAAEPATELARWLVLSPSGLHPMAFDLSGQTGSTPNPRTVRIEEATRFGSSRAARLTARHIKSGAFSGKPVRLDHAYDYLRCRLEQKLADLV